MFHAADARARSVVASASAGAGGEARASSALRRPRRGPLHINVGGMAANGPSEVVQIGWINAHGFLFRFAVLTVGTSLLLASGGAHPSRMRRRTGLACLYLYELLQLLLLYRVTMVLVHASSRAVVRVS